MCLASERDSIVFSCWLKVVNGWEIHWWLLGIVKTFCMHYCISFVPNYIEILNRCYIVDATCDFKVLVFCHRTIEYINGADTDVLWECWTKRRGYQTPSIYHFVPWIYKQTYCKVQFWVHWSIVQIDSLMMGWWSTGERCSSLLDSPQPRSDDWPPPDLCRRLAPPSRFLQTLFLMCCSWLRQSLHISARHWGGSTQWGRRHVHLQHGGEVTETEYHCKVSTWILSASPLYVKDLWKLWLSKKKVEEFWIKSKSRKTCFYCAAPILF